MAAAGRGYRRRGVGVMLTLFGLLVGGLVLLLALGLAFKVMGFLLGLVLLPLKLLFSLGGLLMALVLGVLLLPFALLVLVAVLGGLAVAGLGALALLI